MASASRANRSANGYVRCARLVTPVLVALLYAGWKLATQDASSMDAATTGGGPSAFRVVSEVGSISRRSMSRGTVDAAQQVVTPVRPKTVAGLETRAWACMQVGKNGGALVAGVAHAFAAAACRHLD